MARLKQAELDSELAAARQAAEDADAVVLPLNQQVHALTENAEAAEVGAAVKKAQGLTDEAQELLEIARSNRNAAAAKDYKADEAQKAAELAHARVRTLSLAVLKHMSTPIENYT